MYIEEMKETGGKKKMRIYPKRVYSKDEVDEKLREQKRELRNKRL